MSNPAYWLTPISEERRKSHGCLTCELSGAIPITFPLDREIAVGFGCAVCTKDGQVVLEEPQSRYDGDGEIIEEELDYPTGVDAEALACLDPDHDWRIQLEGPLSGRTYQRQGDMSWVLVEQNEGFA